MIRFLIHLVGSWLLGLRYRVRISGVREVEQRGKESQNGGQKKGILFLPNHPALIDPIIVISKLFPAFRPRSLGDQQRLAFPGVAQLARLFGAIPIPEGERAGVQKALDACVDVLRAGENLVLYPAGRLMRSSREELGGNSGVEAILARVPEARVVLVRTSGLWGSSFSHGQGTLPPLGKVLLKNVRRLFASLLFFAPRREVAIELVEPSDFPRQEGRGAMNRYLEAFYNAGARAPWYVPYTPWSREKARELPEPTVQRPQGDPAAVSEAVRGQVFQKVQQMSGASHLEMGSDLARDLGMDSLARMELLVYVEQEFGHPCSDPEGLQTVGDIVLAAAGQAVQGAATVAPPAAVWLATRAERPGLPAGATVMEAFLAQAALDPARVAVADAAGTARTYRDLLVGILALRPQIQAMEGKYVGIMLPASGGVALLYFAVLFAGKVPVMVNWTVGSRNLAHGLEVLGVRHVITAQALLTRLQKQGVDLGRAAEVMRPIEQIGKRIPAWQKLAAALRARLSWSSLRRVAREARPEDHAVVLFTSGSESLPKAVPLSHGNLMANARDVLAIVKLRPGDKMMGFLPPFHSFGLMGNVLLPLAAGIPVVFHPNPTEGLAIARIMGAYRTTLLVGTPTFLGGIVRAATDEDLASLRLAVTGAEKCPEALFDTLARRWPRVVVLEGYGITECSPVVSANREEALRHGSIGKPLPSLEHAIIDLESEPKKRVAAGQPGMLLVRGPSIFPGYLGENPPNPFEDFEGKPWYRTGDLVREEADGNLIFCGRLKRFVKMGGEMISLPAIEEALVRGLGRAPGSEEDAKIELAVEAREGDASPEVVLFSTREVTREDANTALRLAGLSGLHNVRAVVRLESIPVLGTGKTDYRALKAMLEAPAATDGAKARAAAPPA